MKSARPRAGFPGLLNIPVIRQLFAANRNTVAQTDIVMLLTPRIVRTHELTPQHTAPLYIGTQTNLGLGGPPPLIAVAETAAPTATPAANPAPLATPPAALAPAPLGRCRRVPPERCRRESL